MKKFLSNIAIFLSIILALICIGISLPATKRSTQSLFYAQLEKDSLLKHVSGKRLLLIGGSNLSFGINGGSIKDSLHLNPINTAIQASVGLSYMLQNTIGYVKKDDIVILAPEYSHFYGDFAYGGEALLRTIIEVAPENSRKLNFKQWKSIYWEVPKYALTKFNLFEYFNITVDQVYTRKSYNQYGDEFVHWTEPPRSLHPFSISEEENQDIWNEIHSFRQAVQSKGAYLFITFPPIDNASFDKSADKIHAVERKFVQNKYVLLGTPEEYRMPLSLMFETPYHLNKKGVELRTSLLINNLKNAFKKTL